MIKQIQLVLVLLLLLGPALATAQSISDAHRPVPIIFDTDMGNDVDDALALGVIHALESRGECKLLGVTLTKDERLSAPYVDLVNTFYGRKDISIGVVKDGPTKQESKFTVLAEAKDNGKLRYPHDLRDGNDAPDATILLRELLATAEDSSVVIAQVGFSTNLARLLDSEADDISPLNGPDLVAKKVRLISIMAGTFNMIDGRIHREYNVVKDIPAAQALADRWPTPIVWSGFEIGLAIRYPAISILNDYSYVEHHPLAEAYQLYSPTPHERPTWDLTSVLWAVRPDRGYFDLSPAGKVSIDDKGITTFAANKDGKHYYLIASDTQKAVVTEALAVLSSQPPDQK